MITELSTQNTDFDEKLAQLLAWEEVSDKAVVSTVEEIVHRVKTEGDKALGTPTGL